MNETINHLAKWREENKGVKTIQLDPLEKSRQNPKSKVLAIRAFCFDCVGGVKAEVTLCPSKSCPLWLHRPWQKKEEDEELLESNIQVNSQAFSLCLGNELGKMYSDAGMLNLTGDYLKELI